MRKSFRENYPFLRRVVEVSALWGMVVFSAVSVCVPGVFAVEPSGSAKSAPSLRVGFVPPPFEGTISLGVYDKTGKRIRTLRSEAQAADFTVALNGFVVHWDGKDDAGKIVPPGKYRFSGYAVGDLGVTGEAYHGNDWVTGEDAPHLSAFQRLVFRREGGKSFLELVGTEAGGAVWRVSHPRGDDPESEWGEPRYERLEKAPDGGRGPVSCVVKGGGRWSIEKVLGETLVVQFDAQGEVVRRLSVGAGEPVPVAVAVPEEGEEVFLLEQDAAGTRVRLRGLRRRSAPDAGGESGLQGSAAGRPVWETFFERNRWPSEQFEAARARLGRPKPFVPEKKIRVRLQPNPLLGDALVTVELGVSCGVEGSYLCTADGLPLRKLTETAGLLWAVVGSEGKASEITLIQSDGAVVEEYRIAEPSLMMSFDAGEYVWPPK